MVFIEAGAVWLPPVTRKDDIMSEGIWVYAIGDHMGKVKGEVVGYYEHVRRRAGDRFKIKNEKAFSDKWMSRATQKEASESSEEEQDRAADRSKRKAPSRSNALVI